MENEFKLTKFLKKYKLLTFLFVVIKLLIVGSGFLQLIAISNFLTTITQNIYNLQQVFIALLIAIGLICLNLGLIMIGEIIFAFLSKNTIKDIKFLIINQLFRLESEVYSSHKSSLFYSRTLSDPNLLFNNTIGLINCLSTIIECTITIVYLACFNLWIGLALLVSIIICTILENIRKTAYQKRMMKIKKESGNFEGFLYEIVQSERDIKSLNLADSLKQTTDNKLNNYEELVKSDKIKTGVFINLNQILINIFGYATLALGIYLVNKTIITASVFMIIYTNRSKLQSLVIRVGTLNNFIVGAKIAYKRIKELFEDKEFTTCKYGNVDLADVRGEIEFKNVNFSYKEYKYLSSKEIKNLQKKGIKDYKEKTIISQKQVLNNISFKIEPCKTVAFVGKSGGGKSTILNLISKLYTVDSGEILIDGININDFSEKSLRSSIALVNQFPYVFDLSIRENLVLANNNATEQEMWEALKEACLYDFVKELPNGIDTIVGESGVKLSGGEKQRLAIARAFVTKSKILIFDESTSSLDNKSQDVVKQSLDKRKGTSTIIIVAHRLTTIQNADVIFYLKEGKIDAVGTFEELMQKNEDFKQTFELENKS